MSNHFIMHQDSIHGTSFRELTIYEVFVEKMQSCVDLGKKDSGILGGKKRSINTEISVILSERFLIVTHRKDTTLGGQRVTDKLLITCGTSGQPEFLWVSTFQICKIRSWGRSLNFCLTLKYHIGLYFHLESLMLDILIILEASLSHA